MVPGEVKKEVWRLLFVLFLPVGKSAYPTGAAQAVWPQAHI